MNKFYNEAIEEYNEVSDNNPVDGYLEEILSCQGSDRESEVWDRIWAPKKQAAEKAIKTKEFQQLKTDLKEHLVLSKDRKLIFNNDERIEEHELFNGYTVSEICLFLDILFFYFEDEVKFIEGEESYSDFTEILVYEGLKITSKEVSTEEYATFIFELKGF